jgi:hypothetical protein
MADHDSGRRAASLTVYQTKQEALEAAGLSDPR